MLDRSDVRASLRQADNSEALYQVVVDAQNQLNQG
jgi:PTS system nitrogen regulatory IIA component